MLSVGIDYISCGLILLLKVISTLTNVFLGLDMYVGEIENLIV